MVWWVPSFLLSWTKETKKQTVSAQVPPLVHHLPKAKPSLLLTELVGVVTKSGSSLISSANSGCGSWSRRQHSRAPSCTARSARISAGTAFCTCSTMSRGFSHRLVLANLWELTCKSSATSVHVLQWKWNQTQEHYINIVQYVTGLQYLRSVL